MNVCYNENDLLELYLLNPKDNSILNFFNETTKLPATFEYTYENQYQTYQFHNYIQTSKLNPMAQMTISITAYVNDNQYLSKFFENDDELYLYININNVKYYTRVKLKSLRKELRHKSRFVIVDLTFDRLSNFIEEIVQTLPIVPYASQTLYDYAFYDIDTYNTMADSEYRVYELSKVNASYVIKGTIIDPTKPTYIDNSNDNQITEQPQTLLNILTIPPFQSNNLDLTLYYSNIPSNRVLTIGGENIIFTLPSYNALSLFSNLIYKNIFLKNIVNIEITILIDHKLI